MAAKKSATKTAKKTAKTSAPKGGAKAGARQPSKPPAKSTTQPRATSQAKSVAPVRKPPQSMPYEQGKWAHVFAPRTAGERRYWLVKSEPDVFSFADLQAAPRQTTSWDSVRNTGARNFLRDGMKRGDLVFYYHSNAEPSAIVGICEVVKEGYPDHTALDPAHPYYDAESVAETPTWFMVDVKAVRALPKPVTLPEIKNSAELADMALLKVSRLSVVPVMPAEWEIVLRLGGAR